MISCGWQSKRTGNKEVLGVTSWTPQAITRVTNGLHLQHFGCCSNEINVLLAVCCRRPRYEPNKKYVSKSANLNARPILKEKLTNYYYYSITKHQTDFFFFYSFHIHRMYARRKYGIAFIMGRSYEVFLLLFYQCRKKSIKWRWKTWTNNHFVHSFGLDGVYMNCSHSDTYLYGLRICCVLYIVTSALLSGQEGFLRCSHTDICW